MSNKEIPASKKKLNKAREEGNIARSQILHNLPAIVILSLSLYFSDIFSMLLGKLLVIYSSDKISFYTVFFADEIFAKYIFLLSFVVVVLFLSVIVVSSLFLENIESRGFLPYKTKFDLSKYSLNSITSNFKKIPFNLFTSLFYLTTFILCAFVYLKKYILQNNFLEFKIINFKNTILSFAAIYLVLAAIDYLLNFWRYRRSLRMTLEEYKQELKDEEGDIYLKSMRKSMHQQISLEEKVDRVRRSRCIIVEKK